MSEARGEQRGPGRRGRLGLARTLVSQTSGVKVVSICSFDFFLRAAPAASVSGRSMKSTEQLMKPEQQTFAWQPVAGARRRTTSSPRPGR